MSPLQNPATFRILILSTPKTGNTWLTRLLSSIYDIPRSSLFLPFDPQLARSLGPRWVLFHHMNPSPEILDWIAEDRPIVVTAIRHPADILVSLYHHVHEFQSGEIDAASASRMLSGPYPRKGIVSESTGSFLDDLECSRQWIRSGNALVLRYEDLWRDAHQELVRLTSLICPIPERKIDLAIDRCDFQQMRGMAGEDGRFFRSGKAGTWPEALPQQIIERLGQEPYLSLIQEFGYSMDPTDPLIAAPRVPRVSKNPFPETAAGARFENSVPVVPLITDLYLSHCLKHNWTGAPSSTTPGSFYEWLNHPCEMPGSDGYGNILITNLAFHLHRLRSDLRLAFPELQTRARVDYAEWFVRNGGEVVGLAPSFTEPVRLSLLGWAAEVSPEDHKPCTWWPMLPNFAMDIYRRSAALQTAYPDILSFDRWPFLEWIVAHHQQLNIDTALAEAVATSLRKLARLRTGVRSPADAGIPIGWRPFNYPGRPSDSPE